MSERERQQHIPGQEAEPSHRVFRNLTPEQLQQLAVRRGEGTETVDGVLSVRTEPSGRYPKGKGFRDDPQSSAYGIHFGAVNSRVSPADSDSLRHRATERLAAGDEFVLDGYVRSGVETVLPVTFRSTTAWTTEFMHNLLVRQEQVDRFGFRVEDTDRVEILHVPDLPAGITVGSEHTDIAVVTELGANGDHRSVVAGTEYAGENKKNVFNLLQTLLPKRGIVTLHGSANEDPVTGEVTAYLGLSGTGKTTLSNDPSRILIGDDEHGIQYKGDGPKGIFNFEGGSYAKVINLSETAEPDIYRATRRAGTVLENVEIDENGEPIYTRGIENMRAAYPIDFIPYADPSGVAGMPNRLVLLTAEEGILPAVSRLTPEQALYHLCSGFTAKMPGTEKGITEPTPMFSAFFGHAFLTLPEETYGALLEDYLRTVDPEVYLVNTGWQGGYHPDRRRGIAPTRRVIDAINSGELAEASYHVNDLGFYVPDGIAGIAEDFLNPRYAWESENAYDRRAAELVSAFEKNISRFRGRVPERILMSGPHLPTT